MRWKQIARDYLAFTRFERIGVIAVLLVMGLLILSSVFSTHDATRQEIPDTTWISAVRALEQKEIDSKPDLNDAGNSSTAYQYDLSESSYYNKRPVRELFYFDPNTLSKSGWQKLGLRDKTISTIQKYVSKGGRFKKGEDLQKVYGLHKDEYAILLPYVKIEDKFLKEERIDFTTKKTETKSTFNKALRYSIIDINSADTSGFISLPGIGSKLAVRIVNFRDKLGGFYTVEQVRETFGLPDSTFQKIKQYLKLENSTLRKININTATIDELKAHPYIRYSIANPIIAYRNQHGAFLNIEDLRKIMIITDDIYTKILPYLTLGL